MVFMSFSACVVLCCVFFIVKAKYKTVRTKRTLVRKLFDMDLNTLLLQENWHNYRFVFSSPPSSTGTLFIIEYRSTVVDFCKQRLAIQGSFPRLPQITAYSRIETTLWSLWLTWLPLNLVTFNTICLYLPDNINLLAISVAAQFWCNHLCNTIGFAAMI